MNRWFLGTVMVLAFALAVWFIGPAIAVFNFRPLETTIVRIVVIVMVAAVWLGIELGRLWASRRANKKLLDEIASGGAADAALASKSAEEVATLRRRFEEAAAVLKNARFDGGGGEKRLLHQLPWYVFIGAPGSGKTTALMNSGLSFPLGDSSKGLAIKGVGGTRNCDWWFTDEAVLLDTAGRYTTQESEQQADAAAWLGFLDLLKKYRPIRPLNGAIITVSVSDLLVWDDADRARYADAVRQRIAELYSRLGVRFPLYVMVTKCDLLAGFNEFFANVGRDERAQVWGMTFPHTPEATNPLDFGSLFVIEFQQLEVRVNGMVIDRLLQERDQQRRALIYNFPQQFSGLQTLLRDFVASVFQSSRYAEQAMLRGVYFTSGTQEGSPIDRVLGTLARSFNIERKILPPSVSSGKSFFLTNLLKDLIFPEAGLVGANAKLERKLKMLLRGGYVLIAVLGVGLLAMWGVSYYRNVALIADFEAKTAAVKDKVEKLPPPSLDDLQYVASVLSELRALGEPYAASGGGVPWSLGFGLYQGDKMASQAMRAYNNALREALLPRVALRLEKLMRQVENPVGLYETLKVYLMLYSDKLLEPNALQTFVGLDWEQAFPSQDGTQIVTALQEHLRAALQNRPIEMVHPQDAQLVNEARQKLASASLPDRIYARLRQEAESEDLTPFRLSDEAGPATAQVFVRTSRQPLTGGVPGLFTVNGYTKAFRPAAEKVTQRLLEEESWVLGPKFASSARAQAGQVLEEVRRRYLADYIRVWDEFLGDIRLAPSSSLSQTVQLAKVLAGPDSPLKRLAVAAARQTSLGDGGGDGSAKAAVTKAATDAVMDTTKRMLGRVLGDSASKVEIASQSRPEATVDEHFKLLRTFAIAPAGASAPVDTLIASMNEYYTQLVAVDESVRRHDTQVLQPAGAARLRADAEQGPAPVREVLRSLVDTSDSQIRAATGSVITGGAKGAAAFCAKAIGGRYPFVRNASSEVTLDDFSKVFAPGGDLDDFFQKNLAGLVDTSGAAWRSRSGGAGPSASIIAQFQNAAAIRDAFFRGGAKAPAATAELGLTSLDDRLTHVTLEIDNQVLRFDRVASMPVRITWPSQRPGGRIRLQAYPTGATLTFEGTWALFRMVDRGNPQATAQSDRLQLSYSLEGSRIVFDLRVSSSVYNPFQLKALEGFRCPN